jgi:hypothetical protein
VRVYTVDEGRTVAVVEIEPVAEPPCITNDGIVYERVSGRTVPVVDTLVLARLTEQGAHARQRAQEDAQAAMVERLESNASHAFVYEPCSFVFGLAIAAVGDEPYIERRLYRDETKLHVSKIFRARLKPDRYYPFDSGPAYVLRADGALAYRAGGPEEARWSVTLGRSGAVAVTCTLNKAGEGLGIGILMEDVIQPAWHVASDLVRTLGGYGRTALRLRTRARVVLLHQEGGRELAESEIVEWTSDVSPTTDEVEYVKRQLLRVAGFEEWEAD